MKLELAQFYELEAFSQFASDLEESTQKQLERGRRLREILKQPQNSPLSLPEQVALVYTGTKGYLDDLALNDVKKYCSNLLTYLSTSKKDFLEIIATTNEFTSEAEILLKEAIIKSKTSFME